MLRLVVLRALFVKSVNIFDQQMELELGASIKSQECLMNSSR